jgi:hypothetical protein
MRAYDPTSMKQVQSREKLKIQNENVNKKPRGRLRRVGADLFCMRSHPPVSHSNAPYASEVRVCSATHTRPAALREGVVGGERV